MQNKFTILKSLSLGVLGLLFAGLTGCCTETFDNNSSSSSVTRADNYISFVNPGMHDVSVSEDGVLLPIGIKLEKPASDDVTFTIYADQELCDWYNSHFSTDYALLPEVYYDMQVKLTIPKGESSATIDLNVEPLASSTTRYALALRLNDVAGPAAIKSNGTETSLGADHLIYGFARGNFASISQAYGTQGTAVLVEGATELPIDVAILDPVASNVTVTLQTDQSVLAAFNAEFGETYVMLPAANYSWNNNATIAAGDVTGSAPITVNSLPAGDAKYAIAVSIASVSDSSIQINEKRNTYVYILNNPLAAAKHKTAIFTGFTGVSGMPTVTLNETLSQWTFEYWVKHDDNSGLNTSTYVWLDASNNSAEWRKRVYPPQSAPAKLPSPIDFKFWPQGNQPLSPMMQFTANQVISASIKNNGFAFMPDEWTHLAFTYDAASSTLKYYVNGVQYGFGGDCNANDGGAQTFLGMTATYANATTWGTLTLATPGVSGQTYYQYYKIEMAQMRLWGKALSEEEIKARMALPIQPEKGAYPSDLKAYWPMDEGSGTVLKDVVGGKNISDSSHIKWSTEECDFSQPNK